jgi:hypothetical protein
VDEPILEVRGNVKQRPWRHWRNGRGGLTPSATECHTEIAALGPVFPWCLFCTFLAMGSPSSNCSLLIVLLLLMVVTACPVCPGPGFEV